MFDKTKLITSLAAALLGVALLANPAFAQVGGVFGGGAANAGVGAGGGGGTGMDPAGGGPGAAGYMSVGTTAPTASSALTASSAPTTVRKQKR